MADLIELSERPLAEEIYMIAGWRQWADAGEISSSLPHYLIELTGARKIGQFDSEPYYIFQVPGTHHFLRPEIKLVDGYRKELHKPSNEIYYAGDDRRGLVIFVGDEPHLYADRYANAFFQAAQQLRVKRVAALGGVYAPVPYDKDRQVSCAYSLPGMKGELAKYAVHFSNYEGGVTIGSYLADRAEQLGIEYLVLHAMVPLYDLSQLSSSLESIMLEEDPRAWYDLLLRIDYMFKLGLDLSDLERQARDSTQTFAAQIEELERKMPQADIREFLDKVNEEFVETPFLPLDDVWERELGDIQEP